MVFIYIRDPRLAARINKSNKTDYCLNNDGRPRVFRERVGGVEGGGERHIRGRYTTTDRGEEKGRDDDIG